VIVYVIGPSGVGKSTAVQLLVSQHPDVELFDIDEAGVWGDWTQLEPQLSEVHAKDSADVKIVVDVGAGAQHFCPELGSFPLGEEATVLLVFAPPEQVHPRNPSGPSRDFNEFVKTEYTSRQALYEVAEPRVDVSDLTEDAAAQKVVTQLSDLLGL